MEEECVRRMDRTSKFVVKMFLKVGDMYYSRADSVVGAGWGGRAGTRRGHRLARALTSGSVEVEIILRDWKSKGVAWRGKRFPGRAQGACASNIAK